MNSYGNEKMSHLGRRRYVKGSAPAAPATTALYGKKHSAIFFSGTGGPISMLLRMTYLWLKYYNVYKHESEMTLTYFMARST